MLFNRPAGLIRIWSTIPILTVLLWTGSSSRRVLVRVEDSSGAALKNELVIVQNLDDHEREIFRGLTNIDGTVPPIDTTPGLYRAIAAAPYGLWDTEVREFLVSQESTKVILRVRPRPTRGYGDIFTVGTSWLKMQILRSDGEPAAGATILARDTLATPFLERYYKTDSRGRARIEAVAYPLIVVVVDRNSLLTKEISRNERKLIIRIPVN